MQKLKSQPSGPKQPSHTKDLLLLFSIPLGIALLAAVAVYVPRLLASPAYDFIYSYCDGYNCSQTYSVNKAGQLTRQTEGMDQKYPMREAQLAYYDISENSSRLLSAEDTQGYRLLNSSKSPDGYTLERNGNNDGFLFWGDYDNSWQLANGAKKQSVQLRGDDSYYSENITFLAWVQP